MPWSGAGKCLYQSTPVTSYRYYRVFTASRAAVTSEEPRLQPISEPDWVVPTAAAKTEISPTGR